MIAQFLAPVVGVEPVAPNHFVLTCHAPSLAQQARPGSFVNVKAEGEGCDPLLRKPFSVYAADTDTGYVKLLFSVVGATTRTMARKLPGDTIDMVGPLGGSLFTPDARPNVHHICVGGGYGVPPLVFLARTIQEALTPRPPRPQAGEGEQITLSEPSPVLTGEGGAQRGTSDAPGEGVLSFLIGARTKDLLLCERELQDAGFRTLTATDDGSCGFQGLVTDRLAALLDGQEDALTRHSQSLVPPSPAGGRGIGKASASDSPSTRLRPLFAEPQQRGEERGPGGEGQFAVYCCGPTPMMRAVAQLCLERGVPCQVSMEVSMPCGVGVCMGCVLDLADGRRVRCCTDGPVFGAEQVKW